MTKGAYVRQAVTKLKFALAQLESAKYNLLKAKNEHRTTLILNIASIEELLEILQDPLCTPEILERGEGE